MHPNAELIQKFYKAFQKRDAAGMNACYHKDIEFSDAVFVGLKGEQARGMWKMLAERGKDLKVEFSGVSADDKTGAAHWEAWYTFSGSGNPVHNVIDATFEFESGLIRRHTDRFDLYRWAGQALGLPGKLLGWTPFMQKAIRGKARAALDEYLQKR
jgi:hypothetical protein